MRLDQRVQLLFRVMNDLFAAHPATAKRRLHIKTYAVVPMTTRVGIIEWIEKTKPLKEILEAEYAKYEKKAHIQLLREAGANQHDHFVKRFSTAPNAYHVMYMNASRRDAVKNLDTCHKTLPSGSPLANH